MAPKALLLAVALLTATMPAARAVTPGQLPGQEAHPLCETTATAKPESAPLTPRAGRGLFRLATYNILHTADPDGPATIDERVVLLTEAVADANPHVVGLQEVAKTGSHEPRLIVEALAQRPDERMGVRWRRCWFAANPHVRYEPEPQPGGGGGPLTELAAEAAGPQTGYGDEFPDGVAVLRDGFTSSQDVTAAELTVSNRIDFVFARPGACGIQVPRSPRRLRSTTSISTSNCSNASTTPSWPTAEARSCIVGAPSTGATSKARSTRPGSSTPPPPTATSARRPTPIPAGTNSSETPCR